MSTIQIRDFTPVIALDAINGYLMIQQGGVYYRVEMERIWNETNLDPSSFETNVVNISASKTLTNEDSNDILLSSDNITLTLPSDLESEVIVMVLATANQVSIEAGAGTVLEGGNFVVDATSSLDAATLVHTGGGQWYAIRSAPVAAPKSQSVTVATSETLTAEQDGSVVYLADNAEVTPGANIPSSWGVRVVRDGATSGKIVRGAGQSLFGPTGDEAAYDINAQYDMVEVISRGSDSFNVFGPVTVGTPPATQNSVDIRVISASWGYPSSNFNDAGGGTFPHSQDSDTWTAHRFELAIPKDATILSATFTPTARDNYNWNNTTNIVMGAEQEDNPGNFTSGDFQARHTNTGVTTVWNPVNSPGIIGNGNPVPGADISPVLQQIVNRAGWVSGNSIQILTYSVDGDATGYASWYDATEAENLRARLQISYES